MRKVKKGSTRHKSSKTRSNARALAPHRDYQAALEDYWAGQTQTALEHLTKVLADEPDHPAAMQMYRLWIEIVANQGEQSALRRLEEHFVVRSQAEPRWHERFFALRALIKLELDEFEAAVLLTDALASESARNAPYVNEVQFLVRSRTDVVESDEAFLKAARQKPFEDYLHWSRVITTLVSMGEHRALASALAGCQAVFPEAPILHEVPMHLAFENENYEVAYEHAGYLHGVYGTQTSYGIFAAAAAYRAGDVERAIEILAKVTQVIGDETAETTFLLGECFAELYRRHEDPAAQERACYYFTRAETLQEQAAQGTALINYSMLAVRGRQAGGLKMKASREAGKSSMGKVWMAKLSAAEFYELQTSVESEIHELVRAMGEDPKPGDLCFLVTDDNVRKSDASQSRLRIGAVYMVASDARWHPYQGFETVLSLVGRLAVSVPVEVEVVPAAAATAAPTRRGHPASYNVYELDDAALNVVAEAFEDFADEIPGMLRDEIERLRSIS